MDRDYYLRRHEEELAKAASATSEAAQLAHEGLAKAFKDAADGLGSPQAVTSTATSFDTRAQTA